MFEVGLMRWTWKTRRKKRLHYTQRHLFFKDEAQEGAKPSSTKCGGSARWPCFVVSVKAMRTRLYSIEGKKEKEACVLNIIWLTRGKFENELSVFITGLVGRAALALAALGPKHQYSTQLSKQPPHHHNTRTDYITRATFT